MVLAGFRKWVSVFYVISMFLLYGHLGHSVSMFSIIGIRSIRVKKLVLLKLMHGSFWVSRRTNFSDSPKVWVGSFFDPTFFSKTLVSY